MNKKIMIISNAFPKRFNVNMGSYVLDQANALAEQGCDITVVSPIPFFPKVVGNFIKKKNIDNYSKLKNIYEYQGISVYAPKTYMYGRLFRKNPNLEYWLYKGTVLKTIEELVCTQKFDLIYAVGIMLEGRLAKEISEKYRIPYVVVEHSDTNVNECCLDTRKKKIYSLVCDSAKKIFFVSSKSKCNFERKFGVHLNSVSLINGFKSENTHGYVRENDGVLHIVAVGFLEERKGWKNLLSVIKDIYEDFGACVELSIIGKGPMKDEIVLYINENKLERVIKFIGPVSHHEVLKRMAEANLFILWSQNEPFGIVYLEAMSVGTPVIGTTNEGISEIITNGKNGWLIDYGAISDMEKLLADILAGRYNLADIGLKAKKTALSYTWEANAANWLRCIFDEDGSE